MRVTLIAAWILLGLFILGTVCGGIILFIAANIPVIRTLFVTLGPLEYLLLMLFGALADALVAPQIFRRLRLRPLVIPVCPHCHKRPEYTGTIEERWPRAVVVCPLCNGLITLWYDPAATTDDLSRTMPNLGLRWPQFLGLWQPLAIPNAEEPAESPCEAE